MVDGQSEEMTVRSHPEQSQPKQGQLGEIEGGPGLCFGKLVSLLFTLPNVIMEYIEKPDAHLQLRDDGLMGAAVLGTEGGPQDFMALNDRIDGRLETVAVQRPSNPDGGRDNIRGIAWFKLLEKPDSFLRKR